MYAFSITVRVYINASLAFLPCNYKPIHIADFILLQKKALGIQNTMMQKSEFSKMQDCSGLLQIESHMTSVLLGSGQLTYAVKHLYLGFHPKGVASTSKIGGSKLIKSDQHSQAIGHPI